MLRLTELKQWISIPFEGRLISTSSSSSMGQFLNHSEEISKLKSTIPLEGGVSFRQSVFSRKRLKETKGSSLVIARLHYLLDDMTVTNECLEQFTCLLMKLRSDEE